MRINLAQACFNNLKDYWLTLATAHSAPKETSDSLQINTGASNPLFNPIFLKNDAEGLPPMLGGSPHSLWYNIELNKKISRSKLQQLEPIMLNVPIMAIEVNKEFKSDLDQEVTVSKVENNRDLSAWIEPVKIAFEMDDALALTYKKAFEHSPEQFVHFVVKKGRETVASASLFLHKQIAGFYNLGVLPEYRHQRLATALHHARLHEARSRGYDYATLQATPMAVRLDKAIGFQVYSELCIYKYNGHGDF